MSDRRPWFESLEPPPGGAARLRRALLDRDTVRALTPARAAFAALALVVIALLPIATASLSRPDPVVAAIARVEPGPPVRVAGGAALEVASARADVQVFLVVANETRP